MKKLIASTAALTAVFALTACGSSDDASEDSTAETVEQPAEEALSAVDEAPVEDPAAVEYDPAANAVDAQTANEAAEAGAAVAADLDAALAEMESEEGASE